MNDTRPFPIQSDGRDAEASTIPWWLAEIAYKQYVKQFGSQQSLKRLAERGGFGREELVMLLAGKEFFKDELVCMCPADGFYALCPVHRKSQGTPR